MPARYLRAASPPPRLPAACDDAGVDRGTWDDLPEELPLSPATLDVTGHLRALGSAAPDDLRVRLGETWSEVGREALAAGRASWRWVTASTLVAAAPGAVAEEDFVAAALAEARRRHASFPTPIHRAGGTEEGGTAEAPAWTRYLEWFPLAEEIDRGRLRASAFHEPIRAARTAASMAPATTACTVDREALELRISRGARWCPVDVLGFAFVGLMRGFAPEQTLSAAVLEASERLARLDALFEEARAAIGAEAVRFAGDVPVFRAGDRIVVDPVAGEALGGGAAPSAERMERLRVAIRAPDQGLDTPCTCREERTVRGALRRRPEPADPGTDASDPGLGRPVGSAHVLQFRWACSHGAARPAARTWATAGWNLDRCERAWAASPVRGELLSLRTGGRLSRAAVLFGSEAAALCADPGLLSAAAHAAGFTAGETLTIYAPRANLLFLTDEGFDDERVLRATLRRGGLQDALVERGLPLGPGVRYLATVEVGPPAPVDLPVRRLSLAPRRPG
jgi:hypothetical protein